jgi:two-component system heavy metal sensor histidine kinase CusS
MSSKTGNNGAPSSASPPRALGIRPSSSLALRLTTWYTLASFLTVVVGTVLLYWVLVASLERAHDAFLVDKIQVLREMLHNRPGEIAELREEVEETWAPRQYARVYGRILDPNGKILAESPGMSGLAPSAFPKAEAPLGTLPSQGIEVTDSSGRAFRVMSARAMLGRSDNLPVVQVALDTANERKLLAGYRRRAWLVLALALVVCGVVGYQIARRGMHPIEDITATARRVSSSRLHERIEAVALPAELSELAATFNNMLDRLADSFARLSQFSADIAHELRTPVNNLRGTTEVVLGRARSAEEYREALASCLEESIRLSRIIDSLLFLARSESGRNPIHTERVEIGKELELVKEFFDAAAVEAGVELMLDLCPGPVYAPLDRTLFQRAVSNLVSNALVHTPAAGTVTVSCASDDGFARVRVADTGCGIPPEHLPHVFDRFYRVERSRTNSSGSGGTGLGLAIVRSIASLHGGSAEIDSHPSRGTRVTLSFPLEPAPPRAPSLAPATTAALGEG